MLLSICIPTHHGRAGVLRPALDALATQLTADDRVELCVSDNASRDGTRELVEALAGRLGERVRYQRHDENLGFTGNLLSAVELATGRWCWFLGSDDVVSDTAVAEVVALVERHPDVAGATLNRSFAFEGMPDERFPDHPELLPTEPTRERDLVSEREIVAELGQLQDFISTQVVDRALWREVVGDLGEAGVARGLAYPHLLIIGEMIRRRPRWAWYPAEVVLQRIGVTSIYETESGYDPADFELRILRDRVAVWDELHGRGTPLYRAVLTRMWRRHFHLQPLLAIKLQPHLPLSSEIRLLRELPRAFWWLPRFWLLSMPVLLVPGPWWRALQPGVQALRRRVAAARP